MRSILPKEIPLNYYVFNASKLSSLIIGFLTSNYELIEFGMEDIIVEPVRSKYIPYYQEVKSELNMLGVKGIAISGAGPTLIALKKPNIKLEDVVKVIDKISRKYGIELQVKLAKPAPEAQIISLPSTYHQS